MVRNNIKFCSLIKTLVQRDDALEILAQLADTFRDKPYFMEVSMHVLYEHIHDTEIANNFNFRKNIIDFVSTIMNKFIQYESIAIKSLSMLECLIKHLDIQGHFHHEILIGDALKNMDACLNQWKYDANAYPQCVRTCLCIMTTVASIRLCFEKYRIIDTIFESAQHHILTQHESKNRYKSLVFECPIIEIKLSRPYFRSRSDTSMCLSDKRCNLQLDTVNAVLAFASRIKDVVGGVQCQWVFELTEHISSIIPIIRDVYSENKQIFSKEIHVCDEILQSIDHTKP